MGGSEVTPELGRNTARGKAKSARLPGIALRPVKTTFCPQFSIPANLGWTNGPLAANHPPRVRSLAVASGLGRVAQW